MTSLTPSDSDRHGRSGRVWAVRLPRTKPTFDRRYGNYGNYGRVIYSIAVDRSWVRPVTTEYVKGCSRPCQPCRPCRFAATSRSTRTAADFEQAAELAGPAHHHSTAPTTPTLETSRSGQPDHAASNGGF
jgi:hypothetical protein